MNKRFFFVVFFLVVIVGFGFLLYRLFFTPPPPRPILNEEGILIDANTGLPISPEAAAPTIVPPITELPDTGIVPTQPTAPQQPTAPVTRPSSEIAVVEPVVANPTVGAAMSGNGSVSFYNREDNKFYRMMPDGTLQKLTDKAFYNVSNTTFNPAGDKAVIEYPDGSNIVYDFKTSQQTTLPKHWEDFDFSPGGDQIAAKSVGLDFNNRFIVISNTDGSQVRAIQELGDNADKVTVDWSPNGQYIALANTGDPCGPDCGGVFLVGQNNERFDKLTIPGLDFRPKWSPSGSQLLFSVINSASDWKPQLWITDASPGNIGNNRRSISVNTWADKCTFTDQSTVYCAVPRNMPTGAGLAQGVTTSGGDDIVKIDVTTGLQTVIARPEGSISIDKLMLTPDKGSIYLTNATTGFLNKIEIVR